MKKFRVNFEKNYAILNFWLVMFLITLFFILVPIQMDTVYIKNYIIAGIGFFIMILLIIKYVNKNGFDIFDPIYLISFVYGMMYFITPIYDILIGEHYWFGYNLFPNGIKATIIIIVGYISFYIGYTIKNFKSYSKYGLKRRLGKGKKKSFIILLILLMYLVSFTANAWYMVKYYGGDLLYFLSLGLLGSAGYTTSNTTIGFISMLSYALPSIVLLYCEYGNRKFMKVLLFIPMIMLQISRGFRFFIIHIAIMFFSYYYIRKEKRPKLFNILSLLIIILIPTLIMTIFRDSIRMGNGIETIGISEETIIDSLDAAIWENFRIYQNFYGMVNVIPSSYDYVYGRQIVVGTLVMLIPRILWPGKISTYGGEGLQILIGPSIASGQAYPNIGEFYYAFGILGVIIFMWLYGFWMKNIRLKYMSKSKGALANIIFSILLASNLQLIIRGYTPSNFWFIIFSLIPVWVIKLACRIKFK